MAALSLVATLLFGGLAGYGFWISHHMATEGVTTTAIVTEVETDGDVILDFTTDQGRKVTAELTWLSFDLPEVDDEVQITYDPDDVSYVVPAGSDEDRVLAMVFFVIAGVGLMVAVGSAAGATLVHRARSRTANQLG